MKIHTFTIVVGNRACNCRCPYCISRMTPFVGNDKKPEVNWRNFDVACRFAEMSGVTTVLLTGKGEPTLAPKLITEYLQKLKPYRFPFIELQTNGVALDPLHPACELKSAETWYKLGMTLVSVSVSHYDYAENNRIIQPPEFRTKKGNQISFNFWRTIDALHEIGFSVRLNCTMVKGAVDSPRQLNRLTTDCAMHKVEQTTVRMVTKPENSLNGEVAEWVHTHQIDDSWVEEHIRNSGGVHLLDLPHGAKVYDCGGQNICIGNCLTGTTDREDIRQLIFFPDGTLSFDWRYKGARFL